MKTTLSIITLFLTVQLGYSQTIYLDDPSQTDPTKEIKIMVNLNATSNEWGIVELAAGGEDMYIWTWKPAELSASHPLANGIGPTAWKNSNELLKMTKEDEGLYSFTMIPTEFYEVDAKTVYDNDISLLVKPKDGGGFGDPDRKTEDLILPFDPPAGPSKIFYTFPNTYGPDLDSVKLQMNDVFSILYDVNEDPKESMSEGSSFYFYPVLTGTDSMQYKLARNVKAAAEYPELELKLNSQGVYQSSKLLSSFISMFNLPVGVEAASIEIQIAKAVVINSNDVSDETLNFNFVICQ